MAQPDMLQGLHDGIAEQQQQAAAEEVEKNFPPEAMKMPSIEQILKMIETLNITDEEKEEIRKNVMNPNFQDVMGGSKNAMPAVSPIYVLLCVLLLLAIFVFFGYKLYMSLTEKERKREEKKRQKLQKKKK